MGVPIGWGGRLTSHKKPPLFQEWIAQVQAHEALATRYHRWMPVEGWVGSLGTIIWRDQRSASNKLYANVCKCCMEVIFLLNDFPWYIESCCGFWCNYSDVCSELCASHLPGWKPICLTWKTWGNNLGKKDTYPFCCTSKKRVAAEWCACW